MKHPNNNKKKTVLININIPLFQIWQNAGKIHQKDSWRQKHGKSFRIIIKNRLLNKTEKLILNYC